MAEYKRRSDKLLELVDNAADAMVAKDAYIEKLQRENAQLRRQVTSLTIEATNN